MLPTFNNEGKLCINRGYNHQYNSKVELQRVSDKGECAQWVKTPAPTVPNTSGTHTLPCYCHIRATIVLSMVHHPNNTWSAVVLWLWIDGVEQNNVLQFVTKYKDFVLGKTTRGINTPKILSYYIQCVLKIITQNVLS